MGVGLAESHVVAVGGVLMRCGGDDAHQRGGDGGVAEVS